MKRRIQFLFTCSIVVAVFIAPGKPLAAPYYQGKVITIMVPLSSGGPDMVSRVLARHLPKYIPGNPSVIVQNMPGGGGRTGTNWLYEQAKPDGLSIGNLPRSFPITQLLFGPKAKEKRDPTIRFDYSKFTWLGAPLVQAEVLSIRTDLPYKTFDDLLKAKEPINIGMPMGAGSIEAIFLDLLKDYAGLKVNKIQYPGGQDILLAIERKEVDGRISTYGSVKPYIERGTLRPLLRGVATEPGIENLPINVNYTTDKMVKEVMNVISKIDTTGQPIAAPPGTPSDVMSILRQAFRKTVEDPKAQEDVEKLDLRFQFVSHEEVLNVINYILNQPPEIIKMLDKYSK